MLEVLLNWFVSTKEDVWIMYYSLMLRYFSGTSRFVFFKRQSRVNHWIFYHINPCNLGSFLAPTEKMKKNGVETFNDSKNIQKLHKFHGESKGKPFQPPRNYSPFHKA